MSHPEKKAFVGNSFKEQATDFLGTKGPQAGERSDILGCYIEYLEVSVF